MEPKYIKRSKAFAKELLGSVICYNATKYLITVVEIYPYDEEPDDNGKHISYVNREDNGKGKEILTGKDKPGTIFTYSAMIHVVGKCEKYSDNGRCDNALIRGAIKIKDGKLIVDKKNKSMNYKEGRPDTLCRTIFNKQSGIGFRAYKTDDTEMQIDYSKIYSIKDKDIVVGDRINIQKEKNNNLRFYLSCDFLMDKI